MTYFYLDLEKGATGDWNKPGTNRYAVERYSELHSHQVTLNVTAIRPGLTFILVDQENKQQLSFDFEAKKAYLSITYCIRGNGSSTINSNYEKQKVISTAPLESVFSFFPGTWGTLKFHQGEPYQMFRLFIDPQLFFKYLGDDIDLIPKRLAAIHTVRENIGFMKPFQTTYQEQMIIHQILNCPFQGASRKMFIEGSCMELLGICIAKLGGDFKKSKKKEIPLSKSDIDSIYYARDLLIKDIANPPTIMNLARQSGINEFKLKQGFRKIFLTSVYQYYQKNRMERAKLLLYEGKLNVSNVAWEVGYTNVSHFISTYKRTFGINPGSLLKERRNF